MCLAIVVPAKEYSGETFDYDWIYDAWDTNPDGAGFAYANDGKVEIVKGYFDPDELVRELDIYRENFKHSDFLVHLRWASAGEISKENTHPFRISDKQVFIHNGTIHGMKPKKGDVRSDTQIFAEWLKKLPSDWYLQAGLVDLVEDYLGMSKIAILDATGEAIVLNDSLGIYEGDVWLSNDYYTGKYLRDDKGKKIKKSSAIYAPKDICLVCGEKLATPDEKASGLCVMCDNTNAFNYYY